MVVYVVNRFFYSNNFLRILIYIFSLTAFGKQTRLGSITFPIPKTPYSLLNKIGPVPSAIGLISAYFLKGCFLNITRLTKNILKFR